MRCVKRAPPAATGCCALTGHGRPARTGRQPALRMRLQLARCTVRPWAGTDARLPGAPRQQSQRVHPPARSLSVSLRIEHGRGFLDWIVRQAAPTVWAIEVDGEAAGGIGIELQTDVERVSAEIGYWLGEPVWGRGIATEALTAVPPKRSGGSRSRASMRYPLPIIAASVRVLEKAGYVHGRTPSPKRDQGRQGPRSIACTRPTNPYEKATLSSCVPSCLAVARSPLNQTPAPRFPLTVDSIMRGPELVGNPPNNLRWSGDSKELYFEWLMPKEDLPATWVVAATAAAPRRLTEAERRSAPLANGQWDADAPPHSRRRSRRHRRHRHRGRKRIDVTRTTGSGIEPALGARRNARDLRARQQPVHRAGRETSTGRRPRAAHRRGGAPAPIRALTDSQKFLKEEEAEAARLGRGRSGPPQAPRGARSRPRAAEVRAGRAPDHCRCGGLGATASSLTWSMNDRAQARASQVPRLRQRVGVHRRDQCAHQGRRRAGSPPAGGSQPRDRRGRLGRARWRQRADRDSEAAGWRRAAAGREAGARRQSATCDGARRCCRRTAASRWCRCARPTTPSAGWR